jgi:hypothetical protein
MERDERFLWRWQFFDTFLFFSVNKDTRGLLLVFDEA